MSKDNEGCSISLIKHLQDKTGLFYPRCLKFIEHKYTYEVEDIDERLDMKCLCGKSNIKEINVFMFDFKDKYEEFDIGSICIDRISNDKELINFPDIYKHWKQQAKKAILEVKKLRNKNKKCIKCNKPWDKPRCFHQGLCMNCRTNRQRLREILNIKIILPKYSGHILGDLINDEPGFENYMMWCIDKETRQSDIFQEFFNYKHLLDLV